MKTPSLRLQVSWAVTVIYLVVFVLLVFWYHNAHKDQYLTVEKARLQAQLQALAPSLAIDLQFGYYDSIKDSVAKFMAQNSELLATRVVQNGEVVFEFARTIDDIVMLEKPSPRTIYAREKILSSVSSSLSFDYIESIMSEKNLNLLLKDYYGMVLGGAVIFGVSLVVLNIVLMYMFRPLTHLATAMGEYDPKRRGLDLDICSNPSEIATISKSAIAMVKRIESYADEIIEKDREMLFRLRQAHMGEMLTMIAHQWRQPLSSIGAISTNIQLLIDLDKCSMVDVRELLKKIDIHTAYLSSTVSDFRNLYNPNKQPKPTNLKLLCNRAIDLMGGTLTNNKITINSQLEFSSKAVTYPEELLQALIAILKNALDILIEREVANPTIMLSSSEDERFFVITVCDNGGGIDLAIIDKIYELYFSTKDEKNGTGLGLYLSKMLIEEHCKGKLTARNSVEGACFDISIPKKGSE